MMYTLIATFTLLALAVVGANAVGVKKLNPDTVDELSVPAYLGLWYQMYADQVVISSFEQNCFCVTAKVIITINSSFVHVFKFIHILLLFVFIVSMAT